MKDYLLSLPIQVSLVDYGGSRTVGKVSCRALGADTRERLFSVPSQCMACRLEGIEAAQWTQQAIDFFQGIYRPAAPKVLS